MKYIKVILFFLLIQLSFIFIRESNQIIFLNDVFFNNGKIDLLFRTYNLIVGYYFLAMFSNKSENLFLMKDYLFLRIDKNRKNVFLKFLYYKILDLIIIFLIVDIIMMIIFNFNKIDNIYIFNLIKFVLTFVFLIFMYVFFRIKYFNRQYSFFIIYFIYCILMYLNIIKIGNIFLFIIQILCIIIFYINSKTILQKGEIYDFNKKRK